MSWLKNLLNRYGGKHMRCKNVKTITKRIVLVISIIIVTVSYILTDYQDYTVLINSAICAPVFYSWVLRPILIKCNIGYKKYDDTLN